MHRFAWPSRLLLNGRGQGWSFWVQPPLATTETPFSCLLGSASSLNGLSLSASPMWWVSSEMEPMMYIARKGLSLHLLAHKHPLNPLNTAPCHECCLKASLELVWATERIAQ